MRAVWGLDPLRAQPVQRDQRLLPGPLDRDRRANADAPRLDDRRGVGAVGLVPADWRAAIRIS